MMQNGALVLGSCPSLLVPLSTCNFAFLTRTADCGRGLFGSPCGESQRGKKIQPLG